VRLLDVVFGRVVDLGVGRISSVAFSPDGERFVLGRLDGVVELRSSRTGALDRTLLAGNESIRSVAFSPRGTIVAAGGLEGQLYLFDVARPLQVEAVEASVGAIGCVRFSPDGRLLAFSQDRSERGQSGHVQLWDLAKRQSVGSLSSPSSVGALAFSTDGDFLMIAEWNGRLTRWRTDTLEPVRRSTVTRKGVAAACFSPDCRGLEE
jgi:WD40 repeat protein